MAAGDAVFLTGSSGFVGSHVLRALLEAGYTVRALVRPGSQSLPPLDGCVPVHGDLRQPAALIPKMNGCRYLVHVAALYSFSPSRRGDIWRTNVAGCKGVLEAAAAAGVERAVVTSSSAAVGPAHDGRPATEVDFADEGKGSPYHYSKCEQERVALAARLPAVLVLPTAPVGPADWKPTPTGKLIVDFMRGQIFASLGGGMNVVAVEDVAAAHVLALQHGTPHERYLVGGENLTFQALWQVLAQTCGRKPPSMRIPYGLALTLGWTGELQFRLLHRGRTSDDAPLVPLEGVRMARHYMFVSDAKARSQLSYSSTSVQAALERSVKWYYDHGYAQ